MKPKENVLESIVKINSENSSSRFFLPSVKKKRNFVKTPRSLFNSIGKVRKQRITIISKILTHLVLALVVNHWYKLEKVRFPILSLWVNHPLPICNIAMVNVISEHSPNQNHGQEFPSWYWLDLSYNIIHKLPFSFTLFSL